MTQNINDYVCQFMVQTRTKHRGAFVVLSSGSDSSVLGDFSGINIQDNTYTPCFCVPCTDEKPLDKEVG